MYKLNSETVVNCWHWSLCALCGKRKKELKRMSNSSRKQYYFLSESWDVGSSIIQRACVCVCVCVVSHCWVHGALRQGLWKTGASVLRANTAVTAYTWCGTVGEQRLRELQMKVQRRWRLLNGKKNNNTYTQGMSSTRKKGRGKKIWLPQWVKTRALAQWIEAGEKSSCEWVDDVQANEGSTIKTNIIG